MAMQRFEIFVSPMSLQLSLCIIYTNELMMDHLFMSLSM